MLTVPHLQAHFAQAARVYDCPDTGYRVRHCSVDPAGFRNNATVIFSGGCGKPLESYADAIANYGALGFRCVALEWETLTRGDRFFDDNARIYHAFLLQESRDRPDNALIAAGHSMGGRIVLENFRLFGNSEPKVQHAALKAPLLRLSRNIEPFKAPVRALCHMGRSQDGIPEWLNSVQRLLEGKHKEAAKCLINERGDGSKACLPTWGWLKQAFDAGDEWECSHRTRDIDIPPTLIITASKDALVSMTAQHETIESDSRITGLGLEEASHCLSERAYQKVLWGKITDFLGPHLTGEDLELARERVIRSCESRTFPENVAA